MTPPSLVGELVDRVEFDIENEKLLKANERPAAGLPVLQGITKASLQTQSFISRRLLPGDDAGADRGCNRRQDRFAFRG